MFSKILLVSLSISFFSISSAQAADLMICKANNSREQIELKFCIEDHEVAACNGSDKIEAVYKYKRALINRTETVRFSVASAFTDVVENGLKFTMLNGITPETHSQSLIVNINLESSDKIEILRRGKSDLVFPRADCE